MVDYVTIVIVVVLVALSGLFSGLTLLLSVTCCLPDVFFNYYIDSFFMSRLPYSRFTIARVPTIAVSIDVIMPMLRVIAKPLTGPVPSVNSTIAASKVVTLASVMVLNAFS